VSVSLRGTWTAPLGVKTLGERLSKEQRGEKEGEELRLVTVRGEARRGKYLDKEIKGERSSRQRSDGKYYDLLKARPKTR